MKPETKLPTICYVVPVRAGSKRIPHKNTKPFAGSSLLQLALRSLRETHYQGRVIVSTESPALAALAEAEGFAPPFLRPPALATDAASSIDVIFHVLDELAKEQFHPDIISVVQVTSPLRCAQHIDTGIALLLDRQQKADSVVGVAPIAENPAWMYRSDSAGFLIPWHEAQPASPPQYIINGAFYAAFTPSLRLHKTFLGPNSLPLIMEKAHSVDIDTPYDWLVAEALFSNQRLNASHAEESKKK